ncbi:hypothetical protein [Hansschlegelia zhihuaiae]|uniref:Uncharacterized protein n=1 Tax=Hansschlegelia zhihuaiae TaxID=405005 RepID=A0A4Q0M906_9HYPH|nr:hypothetical protein [Hansschlegelia zhihuaiae]RXF69216.1 hypothetical protein EK403_18695 [Hansschlegelia zhihuaiae]
MTMQEFVAALLSFFLIEPLQAEMSERFGKRASPEAVAGVAACIREATPVLIRQASEDPWQTATHVFGIWSGMTPPEDILARTTPGCARAIEVVRSSATQSSRV